MTWYRYSHLLVPLGGDFEYRNASVNFNNMSMIMDYVNSHPERYQTLFQKYIVNDYQTKRKQEKGIQRINFNNFKNNTKFQLRFSTLSEYFTALHQDAYLKSPLPSPSVSSNREIEKENVKNVVGFPYVTGSPFLPLVTNNGSTWSGYYTGYPAYKEIMS